MGPLKTLLHDGDYHWSTKILAKNCTSVRVIPGKTRIPDQSPLAEGAWAGRRIEASCHLYANHEAMPSLSRKYPLSRNVRRPEKALVGMRTGVPREVSH